MMVSVWWCLCGGGGGGGRSTEVGKVLRYSAIEVFNGGLLNFDLCARPGLKRSWEIKAHSQREETT